MAKATAHFDAQTIAILKVALDEAWDRLPPKLQATMLKTTLAERILKSAAEGERDRERLREAASRDLAASGNKEGLHRFHRRNDWGFDNVSFRQCPGRCPLWVKSGHRSSSV